MKTKTKTIIVNGIKCTGSHPIQKVAKSAKTGRLVMLNFPHCKRVHDALEPIHLEVTGQDCVSSKPGDFTKCAMARALNRSCEANGAFVGLTFAWVIFGEVAIRFSVPESLAREIISHDRHHDFAPGFYQLSAVSACQRIGFPKVGTGNGKKVGPARAAGVTFTDVDRPDSGNHITSRVRRVTEADEAVAA